LKNVDETSADSKSFQGLALTIPVSVLSDRSVAILESLVEYMKDSLGLSYHQIAEMLNRDDRTIWTCYHRAKKKRIK
jgi:DNA-binding NarL/FixJ family response regulator